MRVGSIVLASAQGLGYLARSFYDAGVINEILVVDHSTRPNVFDYPGATHITGRSFSQERRTVFQFCERMDAMWFFELPWYWEMIPHCRTHNVRSILSVMYECSPPEFPYQPNVLHAPNLLELQYFPRSVHIPVPVSGIKWRRRDRCRTFVHNAGHGGLKGRNGTRELLEAWQYVKSPARLTVRMQKDLGVRTTDPRISIHTGTVPHEELYDGHDCFIFPEKFNSLSIPLQEAHASGMLVLATDRFPSNAYLPREPLIPTCGSRRNRVSPRCVEFDEAIIKPRAIAECVDRWYDASIGDFSDRGREYAEANSWEILKPRYMRALRGEVG